MENLDNRRGVRHLLAQAEQRIARGTQDSAATHVGEHVEAARRALRAGHVRRAVGELDRCTGMSGTDRGFPARRAYAQERLARAGRRTAPSGAPALSREALESVLRWLLREEIDIGERAIAEGRTATAVQAFEAAERIDGRCALVALLHAKAVFIGIQHAFAHGGRPDLHRAVAYLEQAAGLSRRAAEDPALHDRGLALHAAIGTWLTPLIEQRDRTERVQALNDCVEEWQDILDYYRVHPVRNPLDRINYRDRLAHVSGVIARLRREHRPDSAEGVLLADLARKVTERQKVLPW